MGTEVSAMSANTSVRSLIRSSYRDMSQASKRIADYVLTNIVVVSRSTISDVANELGVADSTVFQFTKSLGFKGFTDFKIALLTENFEEQESTSEKVDRNDPTALTVRKVFENNIRSIEEGMSLIDGAAYEKAVDILSNAKRVTMFGLGGSGIEAEYAYHNFLRTDLICSFAYDQDRQTVLTSKLKKDDCLILYSRSGLTPVILELAEIARKNGAHIIAVTNYPLSSLAKMADVTLTSTASYLEFDWGTLRSRITHYITDSLLVLYMLRNEK